MKRTPADELARLTAECASGLMDDGAGPRVLDPNDAEDLEFYLLLVIKTAIHDRDRAKVAEAVERLVLLRDCDNEFVAERVSRFLHRTNAEWEGRSEMYRARSERLEAEGREINVIRDYLKKGRHSTFQDACLALGLSLQELWDKIMLNAGLPPYEAPKLISTGSPRKKPTPIRGSA